jgi:hypothetical protein
MFSLLKYSFVKQSLKGFQKLLGGGGLSPWSRRLVSASVQKSNFSLSIHTGPVVSLPSTPLITTFFHVLLLRAVLPVIVFIGQQCADKLSYCSQWPDSYCTDYRDYMKTNCPKKCGYCTTGISLEYRTKVIPNEE